MGFKQLWAPWRGDFILRRKPGGGCIFCDLPKESDDKKNLILYRGKLSFIILNKYPYNSGHLMVVLNRHTSDLTEVTHDEMVEMMALSQHIVRALKESYKPEAFNLGMNAGTAAGAGIKDHLHWHVVPRWTGDLNFFPLLFDTKALPQLLNETFDQLQPYFRRL